MTDINKHKLLIGIAACVVVIAVVTVAERSEAFAHLFTFSTNKLSAATTLHASSTPKVTNVGVKPTPAKININTASKDTLTTLSGIGEAKANAIVAHRAKTPFYRIEDIMKVSGIGSAIFANIKARITVGSVSPPPVSVAAISNGRAIISSVMPGSKDHASNEFVELYNPSSELADLTGFTIKKKNANGTISTLVAASRLSGKIILPGKYLLLANEGGYIGTTTPDVFWPASYTLPQTGGSVILYDKSGKVVEERIY